MPLAVAHRGAHGEGRPENSPAALRHALALGAPAVELDVHRLGDGSLVAWHDDFAEDRSGARRRVTRLSRADVALPPARELLTEVARGDAAIIFDWKGSRGEDEFGPLLDEFGLRSRTLVSSGDPSALVRLARAAPDVPTGLSFPAEAYGSVPEPERVQVMARLLDYSRASAAMVDRRIASRVVVDMLRARGAGVFLWTAADRTRYEQMRALAPDGIMTDAIAALTSAQMGSSSNRICSPQ